MPFVPDFRYPRDVDPNDMVFLFDGGRLLTMVSGGHHRIPSVGDLSGYGGGSPAPIALGRLDHRACLAGEWSDGEPVPHGMALTDLRALLSVLEERFIWVAGLANQLVTWHRNHRHCGRCGVPTEDKPDERAKCCSGCGLVNYPRLSPAVIVAVTRDDRILLARNKRFRAPFFSVLAGFVEPGETLESCVAREVFEEVGIRIDDIRYFGSQPWPFPDSLMVGFTAVHSGGEITVDNEEIVEAGWFARDEMPRVPPRISIAGKLIDAFVNKTLL